MIGARTLPAIAAGIAAVVAAHLFCDMRSHVAPRALKRNALAPRAADATSFAVTRKGEPTTRLVRADGWKIVSPMEAAADEEAVLRLADSLAFAPVTEEMTDVELVRLGRTRRNFGLDAPRVVVTVGDDDVRVAFGLDTPAGDGVYATVGSADAVCVVPSNVFATVNRDAAGFRRRRLFSLIPEDVASFDIKNGAGRFCRLSSGENGWKMVEPGEGPVATPKVVGFLENLLLAEAREFVWQTHASNRHDVASASLLAGYGLDAMSSVSVGLKCVDGRDFSVSFGRDSGDGLVYALMPGGTSIVTVPSSIRDAVARGAESFSDLRLFHVDASAVHMLSLDAGGAQYLLSRASGGAWRLDAPVSASADAAAVSDLLSRLLSLQQKDLCEDGVRVAIGTNAAPVSVSQRALLADLRLDDLRDKRIVEFEKGTIRRVVVTDANRKPIAAVRDFDRKVWMVEQSEGLATIDKDAMDRLLAALQPLTALRVARLKVSAAELGLYGLDKPCRAVAVDRVGEGSVRCNILIGDVTDGGRYVTVGASDAVFVVSSECAAALLAPIAR